MDSQARSPEPADPNQARQPETPSRNQTRVVRILTLIAIAHLCAAGMFFLAYLVFIPVVSGTDPTAILLFQAFAHMIVLGVIADVAACVSLCVHAGGRRSVALALALAVIAALSLAGYAAYLVSALGATDLSLAGAVSQIFGLALLALVYVTLARHALPAFRTCPHAAPHDGPMDRPFNPLARIMNAHAKGFCVGSAVFTILCLFAIFGQILYEGFASLNWDFFTKLPGSPDSRIGMANCLVGTFNLIAIASLIGVPIGMLCGIYLAEYGKRSRFTTVVRMSVDILAGVPSIVVGIFAYVLLVKPMGHFSGFAGAMGLAFIMAPIVARTTEEMLKLVPVAYREASDGVGAHRFQTLFRVILPAAKAGIITGVMLAVARVAGETAPLLFTALGNDQFVVDPNKPYPSLTLQIFKYATSAEPTWQRMAWAGMLILVVMILILNISVRYVARERHAGTGR